jgi:LemA protein
MDELSGTENRIAVERRRYNEKVREYNTTIKKFPTNILAQLFGFKEEPYFEIPSFEKKAPSVNFEEGGVK